MIKNQESLKNIKVTDHQFDVKDYQKTPLTWYACGPTVYDVAHLGHARTYVTTDIIRRILINIIGFRVNFAMGVTDVDDKIINKGKNQSLTNLHEIIQLARNYEYEFLEDMEHLNVLKPDCILRVTEHVQEIIEFIEQLLQKKHAYVSDDGVYFDMTSLKQNFYYDRFGCVPHVDFNALHENIEEYRTLVIDDEEPKSHHKRNQRDFALWKFSLGSTIGWQSPWGVGRPGWHIECSAMTYNYFGKQLDIHSGGIDLKFPHHTNEIVQR